MGRLDTSEMRLSSIKFSIESYFSFSAVCPLYKISRSSAMFFVLIVVVNGRQHQMVRTLV